MNLVSEDISKVLEEVMNKTSPVSVFIFGSAARNDSQKKSDFEAGVLYSRGKTWTRKQLVDLYQLPNLRIYPFISEDLQKGKIDTPFPKAVYLRELVLTGKTVQGEKIIENMPLAQISLLDLLECNAFELGIALGAVLSSRQNDWATSNALFSKSALFGTRILLILEKRIFPLGFEQTYLESKNLELDKESREVINHAMAVRNGEKVSPDFLYKNISFLNQIDLRIKTKLKNGNEVVIESSQKP